MSLPEDSQQAAAVYDRPTVQALADKYGIDPEESRLAVNLMRAARRAAVYSSVARQNEWLAEDERRLSAIRDAATLLQSTLSLKDDRLFAVAIELGERSRQFGARPLDLGESDPDFSHLDRATADFEQLQALLSATEAVAEEHLQALPDRQGGRPSALGVYEFVATMAAFWEDVLHRRFTVWYHQGRGMTDAFEFVRDAIAPLGSIPETQLVTAARKAVRELRETHRNPEQDEQGF